MTPQRLAWLGWPLGLTASLPRWGPQGSGPEARSSGLCLLRLCCFMRPLPTRVLPGAAVAFQGKHSRGHYLLLRREESRLSEVTWCSHNSREDWSQTPREDLPPAPTRSSAQIELCLQQPGPASLTGGGGWTGGTKDQWALALSQPREAELFPYNTWGN